MSQKTSGCLVVVGWVLLFLLPFMPMPVAAITIPQTHCISPGCDDPVPTHLNPSDGRGDRERAKEAAAKEEAAGLLEKGLEATREGDLEKALHLYEEAKGIWPGIYTNKNRYGGYSSIDSLISDAKNAIRSRELSKDSRDRTRELTDRIHDESERRGNATNPDLAIKDIAVRQLKSVEHHSTNAVTSGTPAESAEEARRGIDGKGDPHGTVQYPRSRQLPAFAARIPKEVRENDPEIRKSLEWYQHLESLKEDAAKTLAELKRGQTVGSGDPKIAAAEMATLTNQMKQYDDDQLRAKEQIRTRAVNLGLPSL